MIHASVGEETEQLGRRPMKVFGKSNGFKNFWDDGSRWS